MGPLFAIFAIISRLKIDPKWTIKNKNTLPNKNINFLCVDFGLKKLVYLAFPAYFGYLWHVLIGSFLFYFLVGDSEKLIVLLHDLLKENRPKHTLKKQKQSLCRSQKLPTAIQHYNFRTNFPINETTQRYSK